MKKSITEFIADLKPEERPLFMLLREIILENIPNIEERFNYGVPFYFLNRRQFFIWPASKNGSGQKHGVSLGFCYANRMSIANDMAIMQNRKQVGMFHFTKPDEVEVEYIKQLFYEAEILDRQLKK